MLFFQCWIDFQYFNIKMNSVFGQWMVEVNGDGIVVYFVDYVRYFVVIYCGKEYNCVDFWFVSVDKFVVREILNQVWVGYVKGGVRFQ